jgi:hypothetical protein
LYYNAGGIKLVLKGLPDKIRNKSESYFVEKFEKLKPQRGESSQLRYKAKKTCPKYLGIKEFGY